MPQKIANKDLPAPDAVDGGAALVAEVESRRAALAKVREAGAEGAKLRRARKALKRGQRKLRKARIRTKLATKAPGAAGS